MTVDELKLSKKRKHTSPTDGGEDAEQERKRLRKAKKEAKRLKRADGAVYEEAITDTHVDGQAGPAGTEGGDEKKRLKKERKEAKRLAKTQKTQAETTSTNPEPVSTISTTSSDPSKDDTSSYLSTNRITISSPDVTPILDFQSLYPQLSPSLASAVSSLGFSAPTPIQACAWPVALTGRDCVGIAETGSGKTLAFGVPGLARLLSKKKGKKSTIQMLVVAPTRELALQTHDTLVQVGTPLSITSVAIFGGVSKADQVTQLKKASIVVGTPGRILDLINDGALDLGGVDFLVLDEADRMLDKGFENDIRRIIDCTHKGSGRQTLMFSATWPESVRRLASTFLSSPVRITIGSEDLQANTRITQKLKVVSRFDKDPLLMTTLKDHLKQAKNKKSKVIIFTLYKNEPPRLLPILERAGYQVTSLHGDMTQQARLASLSSFKSATETQLLIATDVAARGLDIPNVDLVINYTFPLTIEDYVHRIGRTGRGGSYGTSVTFFTGDNQEKGLAGELTKLLSESGAEDQTTELRANFSMAIKKKTHSAYGAFYKEIKEGDEAPKKKIVF